MRSSLAGVLTVVCALGSFSCGKSGLPPASPSSIASAGMEANADGSTLKVSAPNLVSPVNDAVVDLSTVAIQATVAVGTYAASTLAYDFELYNAGGGKIRTEVMPGPTWSVSGLDSSQRYTWRVRATSDAAFGPWSSFGSFLTPDNTGYIRGNELYDPLLNGTTVGTVNGPVTFIPGVGVKLESQLSFIAYQLPQTLTEGEFSILVTGMPANTDGDKTKLFAMAQGFGDIVTNDRRMTVEKRGDPAGIIAWRFITHDDQIDTEGAERTFYNFQASQTYFWQATWRNNFFNLLIKEGGVDGRTIYNLGKSFKGAAYDPNPHVIYIGAPVGRSGENGASVDGAIIRQVWVSGRPRPASANR